MERRFVSAWVCVKCGAHSGFSRDSKKCFRELHATCDGHLVCYVCPYCNRKMFGRPKIR